MKCEEQKTKGNSAVKLSVGAIAIGLFGYTAGVLFAKQSGEQTHQDIKDFVEEIKSKRMAQLKQDIMIDPTVSPFDEE